jgi:cystinosin
VVAIVLVILSRGDGASGDARTAWVWLDAVYAVSYVKLLITLIKYTPQIVANYRNKSTKGWSIWQILLDFAGGVLSILQQAIDSYLQRDWSGITGNPVKFALGNIAMFYDMVFFTQHYILYSGNRPKGEESDSLLENGREAQQNRRLD